MITGTRLLSDRITAAIVRKQVPGAIAIMVDLDDLQEWLSMAIQMEQGIADLYGYYQTNEMLKRIQKDLDNI